MAENHETAISSSETIINNKSADCDSPTPDDILLESVKDDSERHRWQCWHGVLAVAIAVGIVYIACATWQWQKKSDAITSQLLQKENVDRASLILSVSEQNMQGEGTFYMAIILYRVSGFWNLLVWTDQIF